MDPIDSTAAVGTTTPSDGSTAATQAEFQAAFDRVLQTMSIGVLSIALEEMIQIATSEE